MSLGVPVGAKIPPQLLMLMSTPASPSVGSEGANCECRSPVAPARLDDRYFEGKTLREINGEVMDHLVLVILYFGIMAIGSSIFIGSLFALPFANLLLLLVYEEKTADTKDAVMKTG